MNDPSIFLSYFSFVFFYFSEWLVTLRRRNVLFLLWVVYNNTMSFLFSSYIDFNNPQSLEEVCV